jgi:hypothetical protein
VLRENWASNDVAVVMMASYELGVLIWIVANAGQGLRFVRTHNPQMWR